VTRVYLDPSALRLASADAAPGVPDDRLAPGALDAVVHLVDAGCEVLVLGDDDIDAMALPAGIGRTRTLPGHLDGDAWFLTADAHTAYGRPRGGTTVLVGPRRAPGRIPLPRFDLESRDLASAAMEILTHEAMA
jgi:hypothetical protein